MPGTQIAPATRADEPSALAILLDGLIERAQRAPLMRRAPAQCSPEEQRALAALLAELAALREIHAALQTFPPLRLEAVTSYWPELGALLAPVRRANSRVRPREEQVAEPARGGLFDSIPTAQEPAPEEAAASMTDNPPAEAPPAQPVDLARPLLEALTVQGRALNTTQMLTWLHEHSIEATREEVMHTLFRHEELFRRRGANYWVIVGQESS